MINLTRNCPSESLALLAGVSVFIFNGETFYYFLVPRLTCNSLNDVAVFQSLSFLILVTLGNLIDIPLAVIFCYKIRNHRIESKIEKSGQVGTVLLYIMGWGGPRIRLKKSQNILKIKSRKENDNLNNSTTYKKLCIKFSRFSGQPKKFYLPNQAPRTTRSALSAIDPSNNICHPYLSNNDTPLVKIPCEFLRCQMVKFNGKQLTSIGKIGVSKDNLIFIFPLLAILDESHEHAFCTTDFKSCD
ncbi:hypothetical protein AGLY_009129, partial [Aphis glycines]